MTEQGSLFDLAEFRPKGATRCSVGLDRPVRAGAL